MTSRWSWRSARVAIMAVVLVSTIRSGWGGLCRLGPRTQGATDAFAGASLIGPERRVSGPTPVNPLQTPPSSRARRGLQSPVFPANRPNLVTVQSLAQVSVGSGSLRLWAVRSWPRYSNSERCCCRQVWAAERARSANRSPWIHPIWTMWWDQSGETIGWKFRSERHIETTRSIKNGAAPMSTFVWITLAVLYVTAVFTIAMATLRKGHTALFWFGFLFPFLWIAGALMEPTSRVAAAEARTDLQ